MNEIVEVKTSIIADLAIEAWRLAKVNPRHATERIAISRFLKQISILFDEVDVKLIDLTGHLYDRGMSVEIIHTENVDISAPNDEIISETISPSVIINGNLFKPGQVITKKIANGGTQVDSDQKQQG
jgi:hypothetical protein